MSKTLPKNELKFILIASFLSAVNAAGCVLLFGSAGMRRNSIGRGLC